MRPRNVAWYPVCGIRLVGVLRSRVGGGAFRFRESMRFTTLRFERVSIEKRLMNSTRSFNNNADYYTVLATRIFSLGE